MLMCWEKHYKSVLQPFVCLVCHICCWLKSKIVGSALQSRCVAMGWAFLERLLEVKIYQLTHYIDRNAWPHMSCDSSFCLSTHKVWVLGSALLSAVLLEVHGLKSRTRVCRRQWQQHQITPPHVLAALLFLFPASGKKGSSGLRCFCAPGALCCCHCRYLSWLKSTIPPLEQRRAPGKECADLHPKALQEKPPDRGSLTAPWHCWGQLPSLACSLKSHRTLFGVSIKWPTSRYSSTGNSNAAAVASFWVNVTYVCLLVICWNFNLILIVIQKGVQFLPLSGSSPD